MTLPRSKITTGNRTHPRVCTLYLCGAPYRNSRKHRFRSCPEEKRENRTKPPFCTVYSYGAPWRKNGDVRFSLRRVEPHRRKNCSTGNRAEPHRTIHHSTEPHRTIPEFLKTAPNRTVGFSIPENRTVYGRIAVNNPGNYLVSVKIRFWALDTT